MDEMKFCPHCGCDLPRASFSKSKVRQDGLEWSCRECRALYYQENKHTRSYDLVVSRFHAAKNRARKRGVKFLFNSMAEWYAMKFLEDNCQCCGVALTPGEGVKAFKDTDRTLDRIDSSEPYIVWNCAVLCWRCNNLKKDGTVEEHRRIADWMESEQRKRGIRI